jgi:hypothetical protein
MSDITNYGYIWYRTDGRLLVDITKEEKDAIFQIISNYSYPCYLSGSVLITGLSRKDKEKLLENELEFIRERMAEAGLAHIVMMQIPRLLYDLFNLQHSEKTKLMFQFILQCKKDDDDDVWEESEPEPDPESDPESDKGSEDSFEAFMKEQTKHAKLLTDGDAYDDSPKYGYSKELGGQSAKEFPIKRSDISDMQKYNALIRRYTDLVKEHIFLLNAFIIERIYGIASNPTLKVLPISQRSQRSQRSTTSATSPTSPTSPQSATSPPWQISPQSAPSPTSPISPWRKFAMDSPLSPERKASPQYVLDNAGLLIHLFDTYGIDTFRFMLEDIFNYNRDKRIFFNPQQMNIFGRKLTKMARNLEIDFQILFSDETKELFRQIIDFEQQPSRGESILYRGAVLENDALLVDQKKRMQSVSFNQSLISGCVSDDTACTLFYMDKTSTPWLVYQATTTQGTKTGVEKNDCIKYNITKFLLGDSSDADSLFFIPPIHPFLQIYCEGELFHPRTKVSTTSYRGTYAEKQKHIGGIFCPYEFVMNCDYLISEKRITELNRLYQRFKSTCMIERWYPNRVKQRKHEQTRALRELSSREAAAIGAKRSMEEIFSSSPRLKKRLSGKSGESGASGKSDTMLGAGRRRRKSRKVIKRTTRRVKHTKYKYNSSRRHIKKRR